MRSLWQDQYFIQETADIESRIDFNKDAVGFGGIDAGPISMLSVNPTGNPGFSIPSKKVSNPLSLGLPSFNSREIVDSVNNPNRISYSMPATAQSVRLFFKSFFQDITVTDEGSVVYQSQTFRKMKCHVETYSDPTVSNFLSTLRAISNDSIENDRNSWEAWGSIVNHFGFSGNQGGLITFDASVMSMRFNRSNVLGIISNSPRLKHKKSDGHFPIGASLYYETSHDNWSLLTSSITIVNSEEDFSDPDNLSAGEVEAAADTGALNFSTSDLSTYSGYFIAIKYTNTERAKKYNELPIDYDVTIPPYNFSDLRVEIDSQLINVTSVSLTMDNNPVPYFYDDVNAHSFKLGRINGTLNLGVPWSDQVFGGSAALRSYLANNIHTCYLYFGNKTVTDVNDLSMKLTLLPKLPSINAVNNEMNSTISFEIVEDGNNKQFEADFIFISGESTEHRAASNYSIPLINIYDSVIR